MGKQLQLTHPFGQTLLLTAVLLSVLLIGTEWGVRQAAVASRLTAPSLGSRHRQFEVQVARLHRFAQVNDGVPCIVLGSSMVQQGFDPLAFQEAMNEAAGQPLTCFNFGVSALTAATAGVLAEILVADYQPRLLIYGTDPRDYATLPDDEDVRVILETTWVEQRTGRESLAGWLIDQTHLYRYNLSARKLLEDGDVRRLAELFEEDSPTPAARLGFDVDETVAVGLAVPPRPDRPSDREAYLFRLFEDYQIRPENRAGLETIAALASAETQVMIVEMPVHRRYYQFFPSGLEDYNRFASFIESTAAGTEVLILRPADVELIPEDGWLDEVSHMNGIGAARFSRWLAEQIGQNLEAGRLAVDARDGG